MPAQMEICVLLRWGARGRRAGGPRPKSASPPRHIGSHSLRLGSVIPRCQQQSEGADVRVDRRLRCCHTGRLPGKFLQRVTVPSAGCVEDSSLPSGFPMLPKAASHPAFPEGRWRAVRVNSASGASMEPL